MIITFHYLQALEKLVKGMYILRGSLKVTYIHSISHFVQKFESK
jgi:HEPN domain-containing protein